MKLNLTLLILVGSLAELSSAYAKEFADEFDCKNKVPTACLRMALRELGGRESKHILHSLTEIRSEKQKESSANRRAFLIAGALQFGNTIPNKDFHKVLELGCDEDKDPLMCFARFSTLSRPGNSTDDKAKSKIWLNKGVATLDANCRKNDGFSCFLESFFVLVVDETQMDQSRGLIEKACKLSEPAACFSSGNDKLAKGNRDDGYEMLRKACDLNYSRACFALAVYLDRQGKKSEALNLAKAKCKDEVATSCSLAGMLLSKSDDSSFEIEPLFIQGCDLKDLDGCEDFGFRMLKKGNTARAKEYFGRACNDGQSDSCFQKAKIEESLGNKKEALKLYENACRIRSASGCIQFAMEKMMSVKDRKPNVKAAMPIMKKAHEILNEECSDGWNDSCEKLKNLVQIEEKFGLPVGY